MANRFGQTRRALDKEIWDLFAVVTIGATGAPTLKFWNGSTALYTNAATSGQVTGIGAEGIQSITRTSTGLYVITLQNSWRRLVDMSVSTLNATGISAAPEVGVLSGASDTNVASATAPKITVQFANNSGAATDPASGDELHFHIILQNSSSL